jgi:hypothetical protein
VRHSSGSSTVLPATSIPNIRSTSSPVSPPRPAPTSRCACSRNGQARSGDVSRQRQGRALAGACDEARVDTVDLRQRAHAGAAAQPRDALDRKVVDRTQLILDIFARRARPAKASSRSSSRSCKYLLPRLVGSSDALSRLGGGIGTAAPARPSSKPTGGASAPDQRALEEIDASARGARSSASGGTRPPCRPWRSSATRTPARPRCSTADRRGGGGVERAVRHARSAGPQVKLPDRRELLVSDTVGFIDRLPHSLVAAFRATLEEVAGADLLLHVIDASSPDREPSHGRGHAGARRGRRRARARPSRSSTSAIASTRRKRDGCARCTRRAVRVGAERRGRDEVIAAMETRWDSTRADQR